MMSQARASHGKNSRSTRLGNVAQLSETTILYFSGPRLPSFCSAMIAIMAAFGVTFPKVYILAYDIGRNFGRTSSAYVITSYYDQAPLDEYALQYPMLATFRLLSTTITMRNFVMINLEAKMLKYVGETYPKGVCSVHCINGKDVEGLGSDFELVVVIFC